MLQHTRRQGQYQGCFSKSHWGGKRILHKWDLLCEIAPKQAKIYCELPNHIRSLLGIEKLKHSNSKFAQGEGSHKVPIPLVLALEKLLMERIHLGEEVTYDFASAVLVRLVNVWNEKVTEIESDVKASLGHAILKEQDEQITSRPSLEQEQSLQRQGEDRFAHILSMLVKCNVSTKEQSLAILGFCKIIKTHGFLSNVLGSKSGRSM